MASSDAGRLSRREILGMALLTLAALALRLALRDRYLRHGEAFTYFYYASSTAWTALHDYSFPNNHIFHSLCAWASTQAFGLSVFTFRLPVLVFGVALVPLTYLLARQVAGPLAAALAAALAGGNTTLVDFSVNARGYGMQAALFVAALVLVPPFVRQPGPRRAIAIAAVLALALLTVPTLAFGVATPFLWGLMLARAAPDRQRLRERTAWLGVAFAGCGLLTLVFYAPAIHFVMHGRVAGAGGLLVDSASELSSALLDSFSKSLPQPLAWAVLVLVAAGTVFEVASQRALPLSVPWLGVPLAAGALFMIVAGRAAFTRNFVFLIPLLCVLAARALEQLLLASRASRPAYATPLALACIVALFGWSAETTLAEYRRSMARLESNTRYLFDHVVRPLRSGDDFAAPSAALVPITLYAQIEGMPLARTQNHYKLSIVQRSGADAQPVASLSSPDQRLLLLDWTGHERERIPSRLKALIRKGERRWVARTRFPAHRGTSAVLWELSRTEPE